AGPPRADDRLSRARTRHHDWGRAPNQPVSPGRRDRSTRAMTAPSDPSRARRLVLAYGWNATAYQILNPGIDHWFSAAGDAVVGYVRRHRVRVVAGAPVCAEDRLAGVVDEFGAAARLHGDRVCYFGAE